MLIPPKYVITPKIIFSLQSIEACRELIDSVTISPEVENNIRRRSILKSSLFSARIEGNPLSLEELLRSPSQDQKKAEVFNILKTFNWILQRRHKDLTTKDILEMHRMVMTGLIETDELGRYRTQMGAIYNAAGIAIYLPPRPSLIPNLMDRLIKFINSQKEPFIPIRACLAHYIFEKIHPFIDGNGRVGRLIIQAVLHKGGYGMKGLVSIEEYLDQHRAEYYKSLENPERDVTDYLEFMLEALEAQAQAAKKEVLNKKQTSLEDILLPRRAEILRIIREQKLIKFDSIRRRFLRVNDRTLRYDLKKLGELGLIRKRGTTKGVYYEAVNED